MRIRRLILERYGFFTGVQIAFAPDARLTVVYGPNEAGKSTTLAALGDFLFGFPLRTDFAYFHDQRQLRLGAELEAPDGRTQVFFRRKGNKDTLRDGDDVPLPESAMHPFLGTANRELFTRMFGLDANSLREGGKDILRGGGSIGASLFQAGTGLHGISGLVDDLKAQANKLYGDRRGPRLFYDAIDNYQAARKARDERSITSTEYNEKRGRLAAVEAERAANQERARELTEERTKAERIRRTAPILGALVEARAERAGIGETPSLPNDAEHRRQEAVLRRATAASDLAREELHVGELTEDLAKIPGETAVLDQVREIRALESHHAGALAARRDRPDQEAGAAAARLDILAAQRDLELAVEPDELSARIPTELARNAIRRLARDRAAIDHSLTDRKGRLALARGAYEDAKKAFESAVPPADPAPLRKILEAVKAEGRLDGDLEAAEEDAVGARRSLDRALAALPLWTRDATQLASAAIPDETTVQRFNESFRTAMQRLETARAWLDALDNQDAEDKRRLAALARGEDMPTAAAIAAVRGRRDAAWRLLRRRHIDGGAPPAEDELAGIALPGPLPERFQFLISESDQLADRRADEAQRVLEFEDAEARLAHRVKERALAVDEIEEAESALTALSDAWLEPWRAAGIRPETPREMTSWLHRRAGVIRLLEAQEQAEARAQALAKRRASAIASLARAAPEVAKTENHRLDDLLAAAEAVCERLEAARRTREQDAKEIREHAAELLLLQAALDEIVAEDDRWGAAWAKALPALHVPPWTTAQEAETAIGLWDRIKADIARWDIAHGRVGQMTAAIDGFCAGVDDLVARVAPDLAEQDAFTAFTIILDRLREQEDNAANRRRVSAALQRATEARGTAKDHLDRAEAELKALRELARVDADEDLEPAIATAVRRDQLDATIARLEPDLARQSDGRRFDELAVEGEAADIDAIPGRIAEINQDLADINEANERLTGESTTLQADLAGMERGRGAAAAAQDMENALAEARRVAEHYAELRLAAVLLPAAIERYRRRHEGPMLRRASEHFRTLTLGRYERLATESDGTDNLVLIACRSDGSECRVEPLSEGTRDQLYLALRVAAIEDFAEQAPPHPFVADDLLVNFDDPRAEAGIDLLTRLGETTQTILFTHHEHIAALAERRAGQGVQLCRLTAT